jgi:hypothetical protein
MADTKWKRIIPVKYITSASWMVIHRHHDCGPDPLLCGHHRGPIAADRNEEKYDPATKSTSAMAKAGTTGTTRRREHPAQVPASDRAAEASLKIHRNGLNASFDERRARRKDLQVSGRRYSSCTPG